MNEFLEQFVLESRDLAEQATGDLLALERNPRSRERLDSAFRAFHTLKGGAGIVDFIAMSRAVHVAEDALSAVRAGELQISAELIGDCLACVDQVIRWLDEIRATGDLPATPDSAADAIVARLRFSTNVVRELPETGYAEHGAGVAAAARRVLEEQLLVIAELEPLGRGGRLGSAALVAANVLRHAGMAIEAARIDEAAAMALNGGGASQLAAVIAGVLHECEPDTDQTAATPVAVDNSARTLRVDAERVDVLVSLTGELTVAKNAIGHVAKLAEDSGNELAGTLRGEHARLDRLTASLQHAVLSLRVLPLRAVFQRFPRVVRELAVALEKPTSLLVEGENTEADKAIVEMLFEPLLHVVRNAMDHGIEPAQERAANGKSVVATIRLSARRQGERVVIDIVDDGRGIDIPRVREVAAERGIVTDDVLSAMSEQEIIDLIFAPGFSTRREVTGLSGRGVGMDAVRTAVERIGGRVTVSSRVGHGSAVRLLLPFSVMMTRVMTVEVGGQMFGIPLDAVVETVRVSRAHIRAIGTAAAFAYRNRTVSMLDLGLTLGQPQRHPAGSEAIAVIASIGGHWAALEVDRLGERMDVMLKPIAGLLSGMPGIAGTTLMGDGHVLLILDLHGLLA